MILNSILRSLHTRISQLYTIVNTNRIFNSYELQYTCQRCSPFLSLLEALLGKDLFTVIKMLSFRTLFLKN